MLHTPDLKRENQKCDSVHTLNWIMPHHSSAEAIPMAIVAGSVSDGGYGRGRCGNRCGSSVASCSSLFSA